MAGACGRKTGPAAAWRCASPCPWLGPHRMSRLRVKPHYAFLRAMEVSWYDVKGHCDMEWQMTDLHPLVLIIDDEPPIRRFLRAALLASGYEVLEATTAQEGLTQAATRQPALILLDLG